MMNVIKVVIVITAVVFIMFLPTVIIFEKLKTEGDLPCFYYENYQFDNGGLPFKMNTSKVYNTIIECDLFDKQKGDGE